MKKSKAYFKLITCLILCATLFTSLMLTGCGNKNNAQPTNVTSTESLEPTDNLPEESEELETTKEDVKKYTEKDLIITPISQYETKEKISSDKERDLIITCFLLSGKGVDEQSYSYSGMFPKNDIESYRSGDYMPYYTTYIYDLNRLNEEEPTSYIYILVMEKGYFELSDFKYHFESKYGTFDKDFSFDGATTDVLKPYVKNDIVSRKDIFIDGSDFYYMYNMGNKSVGAGTADGKDYSTATVSLTLIPLTNDRKIDLTYHYDGEEDFSNVKIENDIKQDRGVDEYLFDFKVEEDLFPGNLAKETLISSVTLNQSGLTLKNLDLLL